MIAATLPRESAAEAPWDVVIVGAGPSGAFAALRLAQAGAKTLLVERKAFPRDKICGGCVSHRAIALLQAAGLTQSLAATPSTPTRALCLYAAGRRARLPIPAGVALPRSSLDAMLVEAAIAAGAEFLPQTLGEIGIVADNRRIVSLRGGATPDTACRASVVLLADGLSLAGLPRELAGSNVVARRSRVGVGAVLAGPLAAPDGDESPPPKNVEVEGEVIHMAIAGQGYVGMVRTAPEQLLVAAALEPSLLGAMRPPAIAVAEVLRRAGRSDWAEMIVRQRRMAAWGGTPPLTHRLRRAVAERVLVLGDAAGYVEPFTGEGIGWALAAAENVVAPALAARRGWSQAIERHWIDLHGRAAERRRRFCRVIAAGLRSSLLVGAAMRLLTMSPSWSAPAVWIWNRPLPVVESAME